MLRWCYKIKTHQTYCTGGPSQCSRESNRNKKHIYWKGRNKAVFVHSHYNHLFFLKNPAQIFFLPRNIPNAIRTNMWVYYSHWMQDHYRKINSISVSSKRVIRNLYFKKYEIVMDKSSNISAQEFMCWKR